jgi:hypothetical protein
MKCYVKIAAIRDMIGNEKGSSCLEFKGSGVFCNGQLAVHSSNTRMMPYYWIEDKKDVTTFHVNNDVLRYVVNRRAEEMDVDDKDDRNYFLFTCNERTTYEFRFDFKFLSKEEESALMKRKTGRKRERDSTHLMKKIKK